MSKANAKSLRQVVDEIKTRGIKWYALLYVPTDKRECNPVSLYNVIPLSDGKYNYIVGNAMYQDEGKYNQASIHSVNEELSKHVYGNIVLTPIDDI